MPVTAIERPARLASLGKIILKIGVLAVLFIIEVIVNAGFLSEANLGGYLGGATQAVVFATLNIIASFLWGMVLIRLVHRRNYFVKLLGILSFIAYAVFAVALNLALAHLREIPPTINGNPGQEVLHRLLTAPHMLTDIKSWILFSVGVIFHLMAMADGLLFFDPYIGYAGLERRWIEASKQFAQARCDLIERLRDIREDATETMNAAAHDLSSAAATMIPCWWAAAGSPSSSAKIKTKPSKPAEPYSKFIGKPIEARVPPRPRPISQSLT